MPSQRPSAAGRQGVLVVAYAFAPASPIGTMRTLRLVRRLDAEGWPATVLTVAPGNYPSSMPMDPALLARVPTGIDVIHAPVFRPLVKIGAVFKRSSPSRTSPTHTDPPRVRRGSAL